MLKFQDLKDVLSVADYTEIKETRNVRIVSALNKHKEERTFVLNKLGIDKETGYTKYTLRSLEVDLLEETRKNKIDSQIIEVDMVDDDNKYVITLIDLYIGSQSGFEKDHPEVPTEILDINL